MLRKAKQLHDFEIRASDGVLGKVKDFYFDDHHWALRYLVVETGSWLERRRVLLSTNAITGTDWPHGLLGVNLTQEQVRNSPNIDTNEAVTRSQEADLHHYYGWPAYWLGAGYGMGGPILGPAMPDAGATLGTGVGVAVSRDAAVTVPPFGALAPTVRRAPSGDPHLRRGRGVAGYHIEAADGSIGHLEDYLIDDVTWDIRYLVIDTRNWLPGRKVVVYPELITEVNWAESRLHVTLTRDEIRGAPSYDPDAVSDDYYAERLRAYHQTLPPRR